RCDCIVVALKRPFWRLVRLSGEGRSPRAGCHENSELHGGGRSGGLRNIARALELLPTQMNAVPLQGVPTSDGAIVPAAVVLDFRCPPGSADSESFQDWMESIGDGTSLPLAKATTGPVY